MFYYMVYYPIVFLFCFFHVKVDAFAIWEMLAYFYN